MLPETSKVSQSSQHENWNRKKSRGYEDGQSLVHINIYILSLPYFLSSTPNSATNPIGGKLLPPKHIFNSPIFLYLHCYHPSLRRRDFLTENYDVASYQYPLGIAARIIILKI